jgi:hypothetical protein
MTTQEVKNILILGATGGFGFKITNAVLDKKAFNVKAIIKKDTITVRIYHDHLLIGCRQRKIKSNLWSKKV